MEIKKYKPEEHKQYLPDYHKSTYSKGDIEKFKPVAEEALEELKEVIDFLDEGIELVLAITDSGEMADDAPKDYYFLGFSFRDGMRGYPGNAVFMRVADRFSDWRAAMKDMQVHEFGHQIFYQEDVDWEDDQYHSVMFEGHAENLARKVAEKNDREYTPVWRKDEPIDVDKEALLEDLEKPRTFGDEGDEIDHNMFVSGGERWSDAEGYTIAYQIVRHLIDEGEVSIHDLLETPSERWREMVKESVEELY